MALARRVFLRASRSQWLARQLKERAFLRRAARRFLPGEDLGAALAEAANLGRAGLGSVLTQLGEQVTSHAEADAVRDHYLDVLGQIRARSLDAEISVKLTHLGLEAHEEACFHRLRALVDRAAALGGFVWVDMEESRYVDATLRLYRRARAERATVGVCLQAYLRRTPDDLDSLLRLAPAIRLVKGAYSESPAIAFPRKAEVDRQYAALAGRLLHQVPHGARAVFGTHDLRLIRRLEVAAAERGVPPNGYEIHMLYGIRPEDQRALAARGRKVRVLISYGTAWFAWYMRRLAERPANLWFVLRSLV
ncbi:MAG TPA: proline dehydrogenase family protein [Gemmatimonadales bacterium]|nr:proline dehydrogenase family protein [Gemmatimonadales bacterium]